MRKPIWSFAVALACVLLGAGCEDVCACPPAMPELMGEVSGAVFTPDSVPIAEPTIEVDAGVGSCDAPDDRLQIHSGSGPGGYYAVVESYERIEGVCLRVRAGPPDSLPFAPSNPFEITVTEDAHGALITQVEHDLYLTSP